MRPRLVKKPNAGTRFRAGWYGRARAGHGFRSAAESGLLVGLLLGVVFSVMAGSGLALFCVLVAAWLALAAIVGLRSVLDAGCVFMLVTVGVVLVVDLAQRGPGALLP